LSAYPELILDTVCSWYDDNYQLFIFRESRLICNIFPTFPIELEYKLTKLVDTGLERNIFIVLAILRNYHDKPPIYSICKQIIKTLPEDSNLLSEVRHILHSNGALMGDYGLVETLKKREQEISSWLKNPDEKIRSFAKKYISELQQQIIIQQRRTEQSIVLRKHQFGDKKSDEDK
jgi:hypothetical protein